MAYERVSDERKRPTWILPLIGCGVVGLIVIVLGVGISAYYVLGVGSRTANSFDPARWRQATMGCDPNNPRFSMYSELEQKLLRERPTRNEVITLLGDPGAGLGAVTLEYELGYNIIDCDTVRITFDSDGRVSGVRQIQG